MKSSLSMLRVLFLPVVMALVLPLRPCHADPPLQGCVILDGRSPAMEGALDRADRFGRDLSGLGDVDGDGIPDLVGGCVRMMMEPWTSGIS